MSNDCHSCFPESREQFKKIFDVRFRAKEFAVQHSTNVVIYENENAERDYLSEAEAKEKGIKPIEILTKYKPVE